MLTYSDWYGFRFAGNVGNKNLCSGRLSNKQTHSHTPTHHTHTLALYGGHMREQSGSKVKLVMKILHSAIETQVLSTGEK